MEIFDVNYDFLSAKKSEELFTLRKEVFKDRLDWSVNCIDGLEFDEYDNQNANYLFGVIDNSVVCSSRLIEMNYPTMITGTFLTCFNDFTLPVGNYIESSRFFVDKARASKVNTKKYPVSLLLFLATLNYAKKFNYDGVLTIVSQAMLAILTRSGWKFSIIAQGCVSENESIYLLNLPVDDENQNILIQRIMKYSPIDSSKLKGWPLVCSLIKEPA
jgi:acyl homoserine lactone synthase